MKHKLLLRQIKHFTGNPETLPPAEENFTSAVDEAYQQRDNYFYLLEHAMDVSSEEFDEKRTSVEPLSRFSDENPYPVMRTPKVRNIVLRQLCQPETIKNLRHGSKKEILD